MALPRMESTQQDDLFNNIIRRNLHIHKIISLQNIDDNEFNKRVDFFIQLVHQPECIFIKANCHNIDFLLKVFDIASYYYTSELNIENIKKYTIGFFLFFLEII